MHLDVGSWVHTPTREKCSLGILKGKTKSMRKKQNVYTSLQSKKKCMIFTVNIITLWQLAFCNA